MQDNDFLNIAIEQANESVEHGGFPAGAVIVRDGEIISKGISIGFALNDPTSHAETSAIREACQKLGTTDLSGTTLYESVECCVMCFSVAYWSGISRIVFATKKTPEMVLKGYYEGTSSNQKMNIENNRQIELVHAKEFENLSKEVIRKWEENGGFDVHS